jgi:putative transcriptional regulator
MPLINSLKLQRVKLSINQGELGKLAGVSRQTISSIERGDYNPSITLVLKLSEILNTSIEDLFWIEEENEND